MCKHLRKVTFKLGTYEFYPDATKDQIAEMKERTKTRKGYFHRWIDFVDNSKDIPYVKTMALVEDNNGSMYKVDYCQIKFTED